MPIFGKNDWTGSPAPEIQEGVWVNSRPLTLAELRGKIVLVDFWEYSCVNCLRTLPYLKEWYKRYHDLGLEIIGVHAPEFEFGKVEANVRLAMDKLGVVWPVVMDNDFKTWRAYENSVWPRELLVDAGGVVVHDQAGEGGYQKTEQTIQELLRKTHPKYDFPPLMQALRPTDEPHRVCFRTSPELYAGSERGRLGNPEGYREGQVVEYKDPGKNLTEDLIYLSGKWLNREQFVSPLETAEVLAKKGPLPWLGLNYHAKGVFAVIKPQNENGFKVWVKQDGKFLHKEAAGEDIKFDKESSYIVVDEPRMYRLIDNPEFGAHTLKLFPDSDSFSFYTFTFESACQE